MKRITIYSVLLSCCLLLSACGATAPASAPASAADNAFLEETGYHTAEQNTMSSASSAPAMDLSVIGEMKPTAPVLAERKIVKNCSLSLETKEFDKAVSQITALVNKTGGYIENQTMDGKSLNDRGNYFERNASIIARIPVEKLEQLTTDIRIFCNVVSRNEGMNDITDSYFDAQAHLDSLKLQEERLLTILSKAEKLEDVVSLETALGEVRYQIEALTAQLKRMDTQVAYSTLSMDLHEVVEYQEFVAKPKSFGEKLAGAFDRSLAHINESMQSMVLLIVEAGPVILVWLLIILALVLIVHRLIRRIRCHSSHPRKKDPDLSDEKSEDMGTDQHIVK